MINTNQNNGINDDNESYLVDDLETVLENPTTLIIGPDAFIHRYDNISLREKFVTAVKSELTLLKKDNNIDVNNDDIINATIVAIKNIPNPKRWLKDFWNNVNSNDYPLIRYYAQLKFKGYIYLGYDNLLYNSVKSFEDHTKLIICEDSKSSLLLYYNNEQLFKDNIDELLPSSEKIKLTPFINCFGSTSSYIQSSNSLVKRIYHFITALSGSFRDAPIKLICEKMDSTKIVVIGADMSYWYNKILVVAFKDNFDYGDITELIFERKKFHKQLDSITFLDSLAFINKETVPVSTTDAVISSAIKKFSSQDDAKKRLRLKNRKVFISYTTDDSEYIENVSNACLQLAWNPYVALEDERLAFKPWRKKVKMQLKDKETKYFIMIVTEQYLIKYKERSIQMELEEAEDYDHIKILGIDFTKNGKGKPEIRLDKQITWVKKKNDVNEIFEFLKNNLVEDNE